MVLNSKKKYFYLIWNKIQVEIHGTKIVFFGVNGIFLVFFWKSDFGSESAKIFELKGILGVRSEFGHRTAFESAFVLNSKFYKSINNWKFWPNLWLWPLNYQKEINSQNKASKINIHYWLRIIVENPFRFLFYIYLNFP